MYSVEDIKYVNGRVDGRMSNFYYILDAGCGMQCS